MPGPLLTDERRSQQIRKLTEVSRVLTYAVSIDEVLGLAVVRAAEMLGAHKSVLMLTNDEGLLFVRASHGLDPEVSERFREPLDESLVRRLQGLLDVEPSEFLGVPLVVTGAVIGILAVGRHEVTTTEDGEWLLSALADQAAVALEKTRLDETSSFRERLIGIVGHDLRTPLQAIKLAAEGLVHDENLPARPAKLARVIARSCVRMDGMIEQLLDFTRARIGGGIPLTLEMLDLREICAQVLDELEQAFPEADMRVEMGENVVGHFDRRRLAQVIANLVANAVQHGDATQPITLQLSLTAGVGLIQVHNQGTPISPEQRAVLFSPFRRAGTRVNPGSRSGLGLGLYIVKEIVDAHGGTISVSSDSIAGTTFTVQLPLQAADILRRDPASAGAETPVI